MRFTQDTPFTGEIKKWVETDGEKFLKKIGVRGGYSILDFGCGGGHYAIPAAKIAGDKGKVYGLDKDKDVLENLNGIIESWGIKNIELIHSDTYIALPENSVDFVLCYDVIHYMKRRDLIYTGIHRVLKKDGIFSLYPKHYRNDYPLMELAHVGLDTIIQEVVSSGFRLKGKVEDTILHDDYYNRAEVFNFIKD